MQALASSPSVSIIIPCFNAARTLARALDSCLRQPDAAKIIVVDDGSSDASPDIAKYYALKDSRVELLRMPGNGGPARARNRGAEHARSELVAFLDADDVYLSGALATAVNYLQRTPSQRAVRLDIEFSGFPADILAFPGLPYFADIMSDNGASSLVIARSAFHALGGFPVDDIFRSMGGEDHALANAINEIYGCNRLLDRKLVRVHYHPHSHAALYFYRAMGKLETPPEHALVVDAIARNVEHARRRVGAID
jgi:glycosyltransferase involved in cell wall biosynthesis